MRNEKYSHKSYIWNKINLSNREKNEKRRRTAGKRVYYMD